MLSCFSRVWLCVTLWTVAHQVPLSTWFSRQEYCSGLPFPSPVTCIHIYNFSVFLMTWPFYHYEISLFISGNIPCPEVYFDINIAIPSSLCLLLADCIISILFSSLGLYWNIVDLQCVSFRCTPKWISCSYKYTYICIYISPLFFKIIFSVSSYLNVSLVDYYDNYMPIKWTT